ncbi:MAG: DUF2115 domain-containing protein [Methanoregula sp.]|nr:MAG: DUF2115 domain-containing protein [Methanoregula sp.]
MAGRDERGTGAALMEEVPEDAAHIHAISLQLKEAQSRGELGVVIAREVLRYSLFELQVIGGRLNNEIARLPSPYRERIRPYFLDQIFGTHHRILALFRNGGLDRLKGPIEDRPAFCAFCDMLPAGCFVKDDRSEIYPHFVHPRNRLFYYLIAAFAMFVLNEPGHPVGMPFPGGFTVEKRGSEYYCLIRDKEKEVPHSICNFCPAKQSEEN